MTKEQFNHEMERIAAQDWSITTTAATQVMLCMRYIASLEAENAKLEKLNSAALEQLSKSACPPDCNNYVLPCNDSDDCCVACWREYLEFMMSGLVPSNDDIMSGRHDAGILYCR